MAAIVVRVLALVRDLIFGVLDMIGAGIRLLANLPWRFETLLGLLAILMVIFAPQFLWGAGVMLVFLGAFGWLVAGRKGAMIFWRWALVFLLLYAAAIWLRRIFGLPA